MRRCLPIVLLLATLMPYGKAQIDPRYGGDTAFTFPGTPPAVTLSCNTSISAIALTTGVVSATITSSACLTVGEAIVIAGVTDSFYNTSGVPPTVTTIPDGTHVTWAGTGSHASSSGGSIKRAAYSFTLSNNRWWFVTPLMNPFWLNALYQCGTYDSGVDYNGSASTTYNSTRYSALGFPLLSGQLKTAAAAEHYYTALRWKSWNINALGPYCNNKEFPGTVSGADYGTTDSTIPLAAKMPFIILPRPATQASNNTGGYAPDNTKNFSGSTKAGTFHAGSGPDPMDINFSLWLSGCLTGTSTSCYDAANSGSAGNGNIPAEITGIYSDLNVGIMVDDDDYLGGQKAGPAVKDWRFSVNENYPGSIDNDFALETLVAAPVVAANHLTGTINQDNLFQNTTFYAKTGPNGLINWLAGTGGTPVNQTSSVSASGTGSIETFTGSFNDGAGFPAYIPGELVSITGCGSYNTAAGTGVNVVSSTTSSFTVSGSVTGAQSGCTVFDGPDYGAIGTLNTAWGSRYTQFASTGTLQSPVTLSTSDHLTYTGTLSTPVSPLSTYIQSTGGTHLAGADGTGTTETFRGGVAGSTVTAGTVVDSTGAVTVTFSSSQVANEPLSAVTTTSGWGIGTGVADEDGTMPSKGGNPSWFPTDPWCDVKSNVLCGGTTLANTTNAFNTDRQNFLLHLYKPYFKACKEDIAAAFPNVLYLSSTNMGTWANPARPGIYLAASAYADAITVVDVPSNLDTLSGDQVRLDLMANNFGVSKPIIEWNSLVAQGTTANVSTTGSITGGQNTLTVASATGWSVDMGIRVVGAGTGGESGCGAGCLDTFITNIAGTTFTLNVAATRTVTGVSVQSIGDVNGYFNNFPGTAVPILEPNFNAAGTFYGNWMTRALNMSSTKFGHFHIAGQIFWQFQSARSEGNSYPYETPHGNAYDGVQDCAGTSTDIYGFTVGGELQIPAGGCYGNFVGPATNANIQWLGLVPTNTTPSTVFMSRRNE